MPEIRKVEKVKRYESKNYQGRELLDRSSFMEGGICLVSMTEKGGEL